MCVSVDYETRDYVGGLLFPSDRGVRRRSYEYFHQSDVDRTSGWLAMSRLLGTVPYS